MNDHSISAISPYLDLFQVCHAPLTPGTPVLELSLRHFSPERFPKMQSDPAVSSHDHKFDAKSLADPSGDVPVN